MQQKDILLRIEDLSIVLTMNRKKYLAVENISFTLKRGEIIGLVGESGCGKSITSLALLGLLPEAAEISSGRFFFEGREINYSSSAEMQKIRGKDIALVFQDPMTSLNPLHRVGKQIAESLRLHTDLSNDEIHSRVVELMHQVGLPDVETTMRKFPHELSGGMRQRVMIAIAIAARPKILIADEPTTALDVTIQAQILDLLKDLSNQYDMSIIFISHDLGVIKAMCDRVHVMYAGQIVEAADVTTLLHSPKHPYTVGLITSSPTIEAKGKPLKSISGRVPSITETKGNCPFYNRCEKKQERCLSEKLEPIQVTDDHVVRCLLYQEEGGHRGV